MKVAILGGGNGSTAAVADLTEAGFKVRWWRRNMKNFGAVAQTRMITVTDFQGTRQISVFPTDDLEAAISGAELVVVPTPAFAQSDIARAMAPFLVDDQVVFLPPGSFGSYLMMRTLRECGSKADVAIAETGTLPWLCRKQGEGGIRITTRASRLPTGVFPTRLSKHALDKISKAFPGAIEDCGDALSGALMNAGPIIHPPLILMNAGPIEHFDRWDIHNEGTQPSIRKVHDALDAERIAVREALGYGSPHFPLADHYNTANWMYGNLAHDKLVDSGDWHEKLNLKTHRYMSEDIAIGLAFLVSAGEWLDLPMDVAGGLLSIAGAACGKNLRAEGRTIDKLGLTDHSVEGLQYILAQGLP